MKKTFEVKTNSEFLMERFERFLALLHHNSNFGHSGLFAMPLDSDGDEKINILPEPKFQNEVDLCGGIIGEIEIARENGFTVKKIQK